MRSTGRVPHMLWLILAVALGLRLWGAWCANLIFDERAHLALAERINLHPGQIHLVSRTLDHPLLSIYVLKLSGLLFGSSDFALRLLHVLAGTLTVLPVYFLGRRVFSERAGLWAAALLAVDQFHVSWSRVFMPEVLMLLFATLALCQLLRALERDTTREYVLLGALLGLAYLGKEPAVMLIPVIWIYLLITPAHRPLLRRPHWYLAQGVLLLVIAPDVLWNLVLSRESYLYRVAVFAGGGIRWSVKSFSLYLGELFRLLIGKDVLDPEYEQGNVYACHLPAGLLYLGAVSAALARGKEPAVRLLLVTFLLVFAAFFVLPGGEFYDPFWWASISLIPAVVCAGWVLSWVCSRGRVATVATVLLVGYLAVNCAVVVRLPGRHEPRATVAQFVEGFLTEAQDAMDRSQLATGRGDSPEADKLHREAQSRYIFVLNIGGSNAEAYYGLARVALRHGQAKRAESLLLKCLEVDTDHQPARQLLEELTGSRTG